MIRSPISVTADKRPLVLVEGGRRVQDRVGDGNLADIMQLRGLADLLYVFGRQPGAACALGGELATSRRWACRVGLRSCSARSRTSFDWRDADGRPLAVVRVHPEVGEPRARWVMSAS